MALKGWVVHKVNRLFTRVDLPPRASPLGRAVMRRRAEKRDPELHAAAGQDSMLRPQHLGDRLEDALQGSLAAHGLPGAEHELRSDGNFCWPRPMDVWHCLKDSRFDSVVVNSLFIANSNGLPASVVS